MQIKNRLDVLFAPSTPKSHLKAFERRLHDLKRCTEGDLQEFLDKEKCETVITPEEGINSLLEEMAISDKIKWKEVKYWGNPLESDFKFRKTSKRGTKRQQPLSQRFHGRVYVFEDENEIVIVSETETDPKGALSSLVHYIEPHEHRIIRLQLKKRRNILLKAKRLLKI